jgi:predicted nucleic acid-binding protein
MRSSGKAILVDTGFWIALYDARDQYHQQAKQKVHILEIATLLLPWPSLYETLNTRFVKNSVAIRGFEALLRQPHVFRLPDEPYREQALVGAMSAAGERSIALVDMVIRMVLEDVSVRKSGLLTFNQRDFSDTCRKHRVEML